MENMIKQIEYMTKLADELNNMKQTMTNIDSAFSSNMSTINQFHGRQDIFTSGTISGLNEIVEQVNKIKHIVSEYHKQK